MSGGDVTMEDGADIRAAGRDGSGDVDITTSPFITPGDVVLTSIRDGGSVRVSASGGVVVKGKVRTRSAASGPIELGACGAVVIEPAALLDTRPSSGGTTAGNITISGDSLAIDGDLKATGGTSEIRLDYFTTAPVVTGTVQPAAIVTQVPPPASCTGP